MYAQEIPQVDPGEQVPVYRFSYQIPFDINLLASLVILEVGEASFAHAAQRNHPAGNVHLSGKLVILQSLECTAMVGNRITVGEGIVPQLTQLGQLLPSDPSQLLQRFLFLRHASMAISDWPWCLSRRSATTRPAGNCRSSHP